jgi:anti-sigma regulatory factor (Ser/Thr protein kinase)
MSQTLDLTFDSGSLGDVRAAVQEYADQSGMPADRIIDLVLVVHELVANAVRHGAGTGRLRIWSQPDALRCEIADDGPAARGSEARYEKPREDPEPDLDLDTELADPWPYVNGHGLWVARKVADRMHVRSGPDGTRATVVFTLATGC